MKVKRLSTFAAASAVLLVLAFSTTSFGQGTVSFCHDNRDGSFVFLQLPLAGAVNGHDYNPETMTFSSGPGQDGHETDFLAANEAACADGPTDPGGDPDPGAVPEPITMLLFGAGIAGVGYATRRLRKKGDTENDVQD